jgi:hypothetical protein
MPASLVSRNGRSLVSDATAVPRSGHGARERRGVCGRRGDSGRIKRIVCARRAVHVAFACWLVPRRRVATTQHNGAFPGHLQRLDIVPRFKAERRVRFAHRTLLRVAVRSVPTKRGSRHCFARRRKRYAAVSVCKTKLELDLYVVARGPTLRQDRSESSPCRTHGIAVHVSIDP